MYPDSLKQKSNLKFVTNESIVLGIHFVKKYVKIQFGTAAESRHHGIHSLMPSPSLSDVPTSYCIGCRHSAIVLSILVIFVFEFFLEIKLVMYYLKFMSLSVFITRLHRGIFVVLISRSSPFSIGALTLIRL